MIITKTPVRISFAGGGSDIKDYYLKYGGSVVSTTINKYIFISARQYFIENQYFLKYFYNESVKDIGQIKHKIIRSLFKRYNIKGIDLSVTSDMPAGSGLGSSSAFTVGLINLCNAYRDNSILSKEEMAKIACEIEIDILQEPIGKQDQYACSMGGLNFIVFNQDDSVTIEKIPLEKEKIVRLEQKLLLFYTNDTRKASNILQKQKRSMKRNNHKIEIMHKMVELSKVLKNSLSAGCINDMGEILHDSWMYKRELSTDITNEKINYYYDLAIKNGAIGGKLLGAGGGGFLLFFVPSEDIKEKLIRILSALRKVDFKFEYNGTSSFVLSDEVAV